MSGGKIYLVQRWDWRVLNAEDVKAGDPRTDVLENPHEAGRWEIVTYNRSDDEGGIPVRAFRDRGAAEAFAREQEEARRAATNPFRYGWRMESRTSLDDGRLRDWLLDAELEPPGNKGEAVPEKVQAAWWKWWLRVRGRLTEQQQQTAARALNNALAGLPYGSTQVAEGPTDLASLDERFGRMDERTAGQRDAVRMGLIGVMWPAYPGRQGERDDNVIEEVWRKWWDRGQKRMSAYQRQKVWEALDRVRFFEVVELDADGVG
jgi:hypothetical protein